VICILQWLVVAYNSLVILYSNWVTAPNYVLQRSQRMWTCKFLFVLCIKAAQILSFILHLMNYRNWNESTMTLQPLTIEIAVSKYVESNCLCNLLFVLWFCLFTTFALSSIEFQDEVHSKYCVLFLICVMSHTKCVSQRVFYLTVFFTVLIMSLSDNM
jgi:hypothetical protein